jgi:hypothetical protein
MKCKCVNCVAEFQLEEHHIVPRYTFPDSYEQGKLYDMYKGEPNRTYLCKKHHDILHHLLEKLLWKNRNLNDEQLQDTIKNYSKWFFNSWKW